ncbi:MAG: hypothetical protein EHM34_06600 [Nitrosopumilales archaeon]|nr:MAG: hypothetical protein EHM34_06600 [Nitrosopumilales archaeon]
MIKQKITQQDLVLYEILRNPALCAEFIHNVDLDPRYDDPFINTIYQKETLCDFNSHVSMATARAVGKTVTLESLITWILVYNVFPGDYTLFVAPSKVHLQPVWDRLMRGFRSNSFLANFVKRNEGIDSSANIIKTLNGSMLYCRIAGQSGTGSNLVGLHTPFILVDEAGYFPWAAFNEMQPDLNSFTRGHREVACGVPTGLREKNVLYNVDQEADNYSKHRVSAYDNPRVTEKDIQNFIDQYGGEDSEDFIHYVLGQHGKPIFALFDRALFKIENYPVWKLEADGIKAGNLAEIYTKIDLLPKITEKNYGVIFGIDLGYTEPTAINILYLDGNERLWFHARIKLSKVSYPNQEKIIDRLYNKFNPFVIGLDEGQSGKSVRQHLIEEPEYKNKEYETKIIPIDFSSSVVVGVDGEQNEIKSKTKPFTVSLLQEFSNSHRVIYSHTDPEMIVELERMTYTKDINGNISYRTITERGGSRGEDHFTSALLCAVSAYYFAREFSLTKPKQKLMRSSWI